MNWRGVEEAGEAAILGELRIWNGEWRKTRVGVGGKEYGGEPGRVYK